MDSDEKSNVVLPKMLTTLLDQHHDAYFIKGLDSSFIYANFSAIKKVGLHSKNDLLYKTENDLQSRFTDNKDLVKEWQWQDRQVTSLKKRIDTLEVNPDAVSSPYIVRKFPFYDDSNRCLGVVIYCKTLESFSFNGFFPGIRSGSFVLSRPDDFFTENEFEVIFLSLQGQSVRNIACRLTCTIKHVETVLQVIYQKIGVTHFDDFSEFCHKRDYHRYMPQRFLGSQSITF